MDVVTISDANLGLDDYPVRVIAVEEDDKGLLTITAEELTVGVSTPVLYPNSGPSSSLPNQGIAADPVNTPLIYEPPGRSRQASRKCGSGGGSGVADPDLGRLPYLGVGSTTSPFGESVSRPHPPGAPRRRALVAPSGWDKTDTLSVSLVESGGTLIPAPRRPRPARLDALARR